MYFIQIKEFYIYNKKFNTKNINKLIILKGKIFNFDIKIQINYNKINN